MLAATVLGAVIDFFYASCCNKLIVCLFLSTLMRHHLHHNLLVELVFLYSGIIIMQFIPRQLVMPKVTGKFNNKRNKE